MCIYQWLHNQRRLHRRGTLPEARIKLLDKYLPWWNSKSIQETKWRYNAKRTDDIHNRVINAGKTPLSLLNGFAPREIVWLCDHEIATCEALRSTTEMRFRILFPLPMKREEKRIVEKAIVLMCAFDYGIEKWQLTLAAEILKIDIISVYTQLPLKTLPQRIELILRGIKNDVYQLILLKCSGEKKLKDIAKDMDVAISCASYRYAAALENLRTGSRLMILCDPYFEL